MSKKKGKTPGASSPAASSEKDKRRWAVGPRYDFLNGRITDWRDAKDSGDVATFYTQLTLFWIKTYGWDHADDHDDNRVVVDASRDNLEAVLSTTGLLDDEIERRRLLYLKLRGVRVLLVALYIFLPRFANNLTVTS